MLKALAPLGEAYLAIVRRGLSERWIDVCENAGTYGAHSFIPLIFKGLLNDVFTLVHETGHSVHSWLSCHNQPPPTATM